MKKFIAGILLGALVTIPVGAFAGRYMELPWTNSIYNISRSEDDTDTVSVFDDGDNKCYVTTKSVRSNFGSDHSISCVKETK